MKIDKESYDRIAAEISSNSSPVGIDAKKTHILILHALQRIETKIEQFDNRLKALESNQSD